jgi:tRNA dimethylallyltransferase
VPGPLRLPKIVALVGPTGVGKTSLALALADEHGAEIVNADALQVYRGFDIGTAKPTPEERARAPHHLVDILDPRERYSAGEFARRARTAIDGILGRGRPVLVVGGSGLYHRALFEGLSPVPPGDPEVRRQLRERLASEGLEPLAAELAEVDPPTASRLAPGDTQRVLRALEVARVSGVPLSVWIERQPQGSKPLPAIHVGLTLPRPVLYDAIERRTTKMLDDGWLREVERLLSSGLSRDVPAFQAIGYRELARHLEGESSFEDAIEETIRSTRRYAKRQLTWFRKLSTVQWMDSRMIDPRSLDVF